MKQTEESRVLLLQSLDSGCDCVDLDRRGDATAPIRKDGGCDYVDPERRGDAPALIRKDGEDTTANPDTYSGSGKEK